MLENIKVDKQAKFQLILKYSKNWLARCAQVATSDVLHEILVNSLSVIQIAKKSKSLSVLKLQSLKAKNCKTEHSKLVDKICTTYGSLRRASKALNVHWCTFHRLCQPLKKKQKLIHEEWIDIRTFYNQDNISFEMPIATACGRCYLTKTLEESYQLYKQECMKKGNKGVSFSTFCKLHPKNIYKIGQTPDHAFVTNAKTFNFFDRHLSIIKSKAFLHTPTCV